MFNFVNGNPFNQKIESALSTGQENKRQNQQQQKDDEKSYLNEDDNDEVSIATRPELSQDEILYLVNEYIKKLKIEYSEDEKILQKLDKYLSKFDVKKFMKNNPNINVADLNMIMFNETSGILKK